MADNTLGKIISYIVNILIYKPSGPAERFVLPESPPAPPPAKPQAAADLQALLRHARRLAAKMAQAGDTLSRPPDPAAISALKKDADLLAARQAELAPILLAYDGGRDLEDRAIGPSLDENLLIIEKLFRLPDNADILLRRFALPTTPPRRALLLFTRGLVDAKDITSTIIMPLFQVKELSGDILATLVASHLPNNQTHLAADFGAVATAVSGGYTALFVDGAAGAVLLCTKGFEHRGVTRPQIEQTVRGNQAAFTDTLRLNIPLVRLLLRAPDLVTAYFVLGRRSRTDCAVMYLESVANPALVAEVQRRLAAISADNVGPGMLEQFIEDHPWIPMPQVLATERSDRVAAALAEGRVAILLDGDPFALVVPISLFALFHSPEDLTLKLPIGTFVRALRWLGAFVAATFPAFYLAVTYYHPEALPTDLALAIAGARERVPFPAVFEVLAMEISFELIREAGTRKPGLLGETIGIVGGIILGQAVVAANLISPIVVVVIAITGLASFAVPDFRTGMAVRTVRFLYMLAALAFGLIGVAGILFLLTVVLCSVKSFGVPYVAPIAPKTVPGLDVLARGPAYRQELRPDELAARDERRQPPVSRRWDGPRPEGGDGG
jgi:spore germination protein KA